MAFSGLFLALTINFSLLFLTGVLLPLFFYLLIVSLIVDEIKAAKKPFVPLKPRDLEVLKKELEEKNEEYFEDEYGEHKEYTLLFDGFTTKAVEKVYAESEIGDVFVLVKNKRTSKVIGAYSERKFEFIDDLLRG